MKPRPVARALTFLLAMLLASRVAAADPKVALEYEAPADCPTVAAIERRLSARHVGVDRESSLHARITIAGRGSSQTGTVIVGLVNRTLTDPSCESLADALAIVVAIAVLDAQDAQNAQNAAAARPQPPPAAPAPPPVDPTAPKARGAFALGAAFALASHLAPRIALGALAFGEITPVRSGAFELSFRLALGALSAGAVTVDEAAAPAASFTWLGGRLDVGGLRFGDGAVDVHLGASVGAGVLRAQGIAVRDPETVWAPLVDLGPAARLRARLSRSVALEVGATLVFPLNQARFLFGPNVLVFEVPPVGAFVHLAVSLGRDFL
ncbi:hypothetical protein BH09MYX1_BH09MYX1_56730 [soil metagenome]